MKEQTRKIAEEFNRRYGGGEITAVRAPGRVNLIGEHTDYNDGFVLPMAIEFGVSVVGRRRDDRRLRLFSMDYGEEVVTSLDEAFGDSTPRWSQYVEGVVRTFEEELGEDLPGFDAVIIGNVPQGAGLSSSAALEVGIGYFTSQLFDLNVDRREVALYGQKAEHNYLGVRCGIMDQFASALCAKSSALFLDCRSLEFEQVPINLKDHIIMILNSAKTRGLVDSQYNNRRQACEESVRVLSGLIPNVTALRDVTIEQFEQFADKLPDDVRPKARHVVTENARVQSAVEKLKGGDLAAFGQLMWQSHDSLRDDYRVSCAELDALNEIARDCGGVLGERMTGAGFGGCAVALVHKDAGQAFLDVVARTYPEKTGRVAAAYRTVAAGGVKCIDI